MARETERLLKVEVIPKLGSKRLGVMSRAEVHGLLDGIVERGIVTNSPVEKIKPQGIEAARDRVLSDDEVRLVWRAFHSIGWPFGDIAKLLC